MSTSSIEPDRKHFRTYAQAFAAIPDTLPFLSNGHRHVAVNLTTGHEIPCANAYIAAGYVAGSTALFKQWNFALDMGPERVPAFAPYQSFTQRLLRPNSRSEEQGAGNPRDAQDDDHMENEFDSEQTDRSGQRRFGRGW